MAIHAACQREASLELGLKISKNSCILCPPCMLWTQTCKPNLDVPLNIKFEVSPELCLEQLMIPKGNSNKVPWNPIILAKLQICLGYAMLLS